MPSQFKEEMKKFWKGKKVFITGHSGFKGSWLRLFLEYFEADIFGYSLPPNTQPNFYSILNRGHDIFGDINDTEKLTNSFEHIKPEIVFHLAAQPLVRISYKEPLLTYQTNVIGTLNVLEAARQTGGVKAFVNVTTDKCYENIEQNYKYKEDDKLGGYDMYSSSKACSEILSASYRRSFLSGEGGFHLATARSGNVIGGGDWAADRLIPDCVRAINDKKAVQLRYPDAIRPWQHVIEPIFGYILLAKKLFEEGEKYAQSFNFAPEETSFRTVEEIVQYFIQEYGKGEYKNIPDSTLHEANLLMLDNTKAKEVLGWQPCYSAKQAVSLTAEWYRRYYDGKDLENFSLWQIEDYLAKITAKTA